MKRWISVFFVSAFSIGALVIALPHIVDTKAMGRIDPQRAASFQPLLFNFSESYSDGRVMGIGIGASKVEAIEAAEKAGYVLNPSSWGDNRAGGSDLYQRSELQRLALRQPVLSFTKAPRGGMIISFRGESVEKIQLFHINNEII